MTVRNLIFSSMRLPRFFLPTYLFGWCTEGRRWIQNTIFQKSLFPEFIVFLILFNLRTKWQLPKVIHWSDKHFSKTLLPALSQLTMLLKDKTEFCRVHLGWLQLAPAALLQSRESQSKNFVFCMILSSTDCSMIAIMHKTWIILYIRPHIGMYFSDTVGPPSRKYSSQGVTQRLKYVKG